MDIGAVSIAMNQSKLQDAVGISLFRMAMDTTKEVSADMINMISESTATLEGAAQPNLGSHIDIRV